jgi:hypothetical protein
LRDQKKTEPTHAKHEILHVNLTTVTVWLESAKN